MVRYFLKLSAELFYNPLKKRYIRIIPVGNIKKKLTLHYLRLKKCSDFQH